MTSEYTPTTEAVRGAYVYEAQRYTTFTGNTAARAEFHRWFDAEIRKAQVDALRAAAGDLSEIQRDGAGIWHGWMNARADRIEEAAS